MKALFLFSTIIVGSSYCYIGICYQNEVCIKGPLAIRIAYFKGIAQMQNGTFIIL